MTVEALLLAATTLIALVAGVVAVVAVRAVRRLERQAAVVEVATESPSKPPSDVVSRVAPSGAPTSTTEIASTTDVSSELAPRVVQGRVVVPPSQAQVVRTALGRPGVRLSIFIHGLTRALRPENRDRIVALMRREYRHRRRERLRTGRQAVRMARPGSAPSTERLGAPPAATLDSRSGGHAEFMEPKPLSLTDRMIRS